MHIKSVYLLLAIVAVVIPYVFVVQHFAAAGPSLLQFLAAVFANDAATGVAADLLISSLVFWTVMVELRRRDAGPSPWPFVVVNLLIGLSCALPLCLYFRHAAGTPDLPAA
jgi:hypothetical protein